MRQLLLIFIFATGICSLSRAETDAMVKAREIESTLTERFRTYVGNQEKEGLLKNSEAALQKLMAENDTDSGVLTVYARFCWRFGDQRQAAEAAYTAVKLDPQNPDALKILAECYLRQGKLREGLDALRRVSSVAPSDAQTQYQIGALAMMLQTELPEQNRDAVINYALKCYRRAIELDPRNSFYAQAFGEAVYQMKLPDWKSAFAAWQRVRALNPDADYANYHLVKIARLLGRDEDAEIILTQVSPAMRTRIEQALEEEKTEARLESHSEPAPADPKSTPGS